MPEQGRVKHAVLVLHGAGRPEKGETLAVFANGLLDHLNRFRLSPLCTRTALDVEGNLEWLEVEIPPTPSPPQTRRGGRGSAAEPKIVLRIRELRWKQELPQRGLLQFMGVLWHWAGTFSYFAPRKRQASQKDRLARTRRRAHIKGTGLPQGYPQVPTDWDAQGCGLVEEEISRDTPRQEFWWRVRLAVLGILASLGWSWLVGFGARGFNAMPFQTKLDLGAVSLFTTIYVLLSLSSFLVLLPLALVDYRFKRNPRPGLGAEVSRGNLERLALIAVAWLSIPLWPLYLVLYNLSSAPGLRELLADRFNILAVATGAPVLIFVILPLEILSKVPIVGGPVANWLTRIRESSYWDAIGDIYLYLTDTTRATKIRMLAEVALRDLYEMPGFRPDYIHICAHSLGTVVAYDTLARISEGSGILTGKNSQVYPRLTTLMTYGSPLNKIRLLSAERATERSGSSELDSTRFREGSRLPQHLRWINIYGMQDIASDLCTLYDADHPLQFHAWTAQQLFSAHGAYFSDRGFWATFLESLRNPGSRNMRRLEKLRIEEGDLQSLRRVGIVTQGQLLESGRAPGSWLGLAVETGIPVERILQYANLADLVRVLGIDEETADLLAYVGVDTLRKLRSAKADDLYRRVDSAKEKFLVKAPRKSDVIRWIKEAKQLPDMVEI